LYQEVYKQWRCEDSLAIGLPAPAGLAACFCIERASEFTDRERILMEIVRPHLGNAYRNAEALTLLGDASAGSGRHSLLLDTAGRPHYASAGALELISRCFPDEDSARRIAGNLAGWLQEDVAIRHGQRVAPLASPLVLHTRESHVTIRLLHGPTTGAQTLLVLQEETSRNQASQRFMASHRAGEVLETTRGLSGRRSPIPDDQPPDRGEAPPSDYNKLGVDSRTAAVAKALAPDRLCREY
jgi:hypothetical protein